MANRFILTAEEKTYLQQLIDEEKTSVEIVEIFSNKYRPMTSKQFRSYRHNHGIKLKKHYYWNKGVYMFSDEIVNFIIEHKDEYEAPYMAKLINEKWGTSYTAPQIKHFKSNHKIHTTLTGACNENRPNPHKGEKGWHVPNSEATFFKPANGNTEQYCPLLTIRKRPGAGNYLFIKVAQPNTWIFYHTYLWEKEVGPLKKGEKLKFLNGDTTDVRIENLMIIDNKVQGKLYGGHKKNKVSKDPEITKARILQSKIEIKLNEMGKKK